MDAFGVSVCGASPGDFRDPITTCEVFGICTPGFYNPIGEPSFPSPILTPQPLGPYPAVQPPARGAGSGPPERERPQPTLPTVTVSAPAAAAAVPLGLTFEPYSVPGAGVPAEETELGRLLKGNIGRAAQGISREFESLIYSKPLTELDRLLLKPFKAPEFVTQFEGAVGGALEAALAAGAFGLESLLYSSDAGAPDEPARVTAFLQQYGIPAVPPVAPPGDTRLPQPATEPGALPEVTVTAPRAPAAVPAPLPYFDPTGLRGVEPLPLVAANPEPAPRTAPKPQPQPAPLRLALPQPQGLTVPAPGKPARFLEPGALPAPKAAPAPLPDLSSVSCSCTKPKDSKKKKKRHPRNVCYRGVYEDRANGLVKMKQVKIPCR